MANAHKAKKRLVRPKIARIIILVISGILVFFALILPDSFSQSSLPMEVGDVVSEDILAPYSLTFESDVLTEQARQEAESEVEPIYLATDPSIGRRQIEELRTVLYYITTVRQDSYATEDEKITDLQAIETFDLSEETITSILATTDTRWESLETEAADVLEQVMRNTLKDSDIYTAKQNLPSLIDFSFSESQADIVAELVEPFIVANSLYSSEQTEEAITEARQSVDPIIRSFISGETLVSRGQIIDEADLEALQRYGLIQASDQLMTIIGAGTLTILLSILVGLYFKSQHENKAYSTKALLLISFTFLVFLTSARFIILDRTIVPYVYPIAAFGLTLAIIFNFEVAAFFSTLLGILTAFGMSNGLDLTVYYIIPTILGILAMGQARRISVFLGAGLAIGAAGIGIILGFRLPESSTDWIGIATLCGAALISGIGSAGLTLLLQYLFSLTLRITTPLQLLDISRPDHPLLQQILRNAPGTYQHSLQVSNLAEQAAEAIGADSLLVRVGAIYHDCGKTINPQFFIENQVQDNLNPHDDIDPVTSAQTIISHVTDGVELAKKYHLPKRIIDFIREHHGTMYTQYQYTQAVKQSGDPNQVDKAQFSYPGPRPQSRETALLMLADSTEARARSEVPKDEDDLHNLINGVFEYYEKNNQLDDTNLTLRDLQTINESFFHTLKGYYHPRVKYPALEGSRLGSSEVQTEKVKKVLRE